MSDTVAKAQRSLARIQAVPEPLKKLLRPIKNVLFTMHRDEAATWVLERPESPDERYLDVLRFGACDFRETEHAHTMEAPVGWPKHMAAEMERQGVTLAFQNLFVWHFEDFPDEKLMIKRRRKRRGRPDVILIQTGGFPAMKHIWGFNIWSFLARENLGRRLGWWMNPIWRVMNVILMVFGRPAPYSGPDPQLAEFVATVRRVWPGVPIEFWQQSDPVLQGFWKKSVAQRLIEETVPILDDLDIPVVDAPPIPNVMALRGANGMNLNHRGSLAVGAWYADHLLANFGHLAKSATQRAAEASAAEASAAEAADADASASAPKSLGAPSTSGAKESAGADAAGGGGAETALPAAD